MTRFNRFVRMPLAAFAAASLVLAPLPAAAQGAHQSPRTATAPDAFRQADALARALYEASGVPAMTVAVRRGDALIWSAAYGSPSLEVGGTLSPDALFRAGSVSKLFTATALMRLRQAGRIDLDTNIQTYLPAFAQQPPITIRQLAGHLGGIRHYREGDRALTFRHFDTTEDAANIVAADPLVQAPGTRYTYSTFGYNLVAAAIEKASGTAFLNAVRELVFNPLGMQRSGPDDVAAIIAGRVSPYQRDDGVIRNAAFVDPSYKWAGGGFLTNVIELTAFGAAHLRGDFLNEDMRRETFTSQRTTEGRETGVGIGWRIGQDWQGRRIYYHAGSQEGSRSVLVVYPREGLSIAIMTNLFGEPALIEQSAAAIAESFLAANAGQTPLPSGRWSITGESPRGAFTGEIAIDRSGRLVLTGFQPLLGFGRAVGVPMPDAITASLANRDGDNAVIFALTAFGYVPIRLSWHEGTLRGQSLMPNSPIEFSFTGAAIS